MIHEIGVELGTALRAAGCPFPVVDRETTKTATFGRERIVIEHDEGGDSFGNARSQRVNPKHRMTRSIGAKITIYAQSPRSHALEFEHRRRAEHVLDLVLVAIGDIAGERKNRWTPTGGRFLVPEDLEGSERHGGAVYELTFTFDRAVEVRSWDGDAQPEGTLTGLNSTTKVSRTRGADDDDDDTTVPATAETACGG